MTHTIDQVVHIRRELSLGPKPTEAASEVQASRASLFWCLVSELQENLCTLPESQEAEASGGFMAGQSHEADELCFLAITKACDCTLHTEKNRPPPPRILFRLS